MQRSQIDVETLVDDYWQAEQLEDAWLAVRHDLGSINAHFNHWEAVPAELAGGVLSVDDVQQGAANRTGALDFSVGCHGGFNLPDNQAESNGTDFCQAQAGQGVSWVANTGFGYGDRDEVAYSEQLSLLFIEYLRRQGTTVGDALRLAKAEYFNRSGIHGFTPYDEKVLSEMALYGLPMLGLEFPTPLELTGPRWILQNESAWTELATLNLIATDIGLTAQAVEFKDLPVASQVISHGAYYQIEDEVEVVTGMPIMPRTSHSVALANKYARGAFFEGGHYQTFSGFDPVIARLITDTAVGLNEPLYDFVEWVPAVWDLVNTLKTPEGLRQNLVVLPAQYSAATPLTGTMRVFDSMNYTVYYSDTWDIYPPSFWLVEDAMIENSQHITVEVTDYSNVLRVGVGYTTGNGWWQQEDLIRSEGDPDIWYGTVPYTDTLSYFIQAVDGAGNVGAETNKARYFGNSVPYIPPTHAQPIYLPLIFKE